MDRLILDVFKAAKQEKKRGLQGMDPNVPHGTRSPVTRNCTDHSQKARVWHFAAPVQCLGIQWIHLFRNPAMDSDGQRITPEHIHSHPAWFRPFELAVLLHRTSGSCTDALGSATIVTPRSASPPTSRASRASRASRQPPTKRHEKR